MIPLRLRLFAGVVLPALLCVMCAAEVPEQQDDFISRVRGIFDNELPRTLGAKSVRFDIHPGLSREHASLPLAIRVGINERLEASLELDDYLNLNRKYADPYYGFSSARAGIKYHLHRQLIRGFDSAVGFTAITPVSRPPVTYSDGHIHYVPYVTLSHPILCHPGLTLFFNVGADLIQKSSTPGIYGKNAFRDNSTSFTVGTIYDRGLWHYTVSLAYATTSLIGETNRNRNFYTLQPGISYDVPRRYTPKITGKWLVGVGVRVGHGPDGSFSSTSGRLRVEFSFQRWLHDHSYYSKQPVDPQKK